MDPAPLRQVVTRPSGPVDPTLAAAHVRGRLPALDESAATVLALVDIAGRTRDDEAVTAALTGAEAGAVLARGRKALRRSLYPLPGSGWCERAERMISDRIDGELADPGPRRLAVHLDNCSRCVDHERRLAQATDALVRSFLDEHPEPSLSVAPEAEPKPEPEAPGPEPEPEPEQPPAPVLAPVPAARPVSRPKPKPAAKPAPAAAPAAQPERRPSRAAGAAWNLLIVVAVLLDVATVLITVLGATGALSI
jgi:hypothetical protein